jgi:hypothetical protein
MISREDVVSAIGYDGNAALVDHAAKRRYGKLTTEELVKAGFYRAAAASAILSGLPEELVTVANAYNTVSGSSYSPDAIPRLFGVAKVTVNKTLVL